MELSDYNYNFHSIKDSHNILADAKSKLKALTIYRDPIEDPEMLKASDLKQYIIEINVNKIHTLNSNVLSKSGMLLVKN